VVGALSAAITVSSNAPAVSVGLSGTGISTQLSRSPASLSFGSRELVAGPSAVMVSTVTNSGTEAVTLSGVTLGGGNPGQFERVTGAANDCVATKVLTSLQTCELRVRFDPTAVGAKSATITVSSNAPAITVALTGTGINTSRPGVVRSSTDWLLRAALTSGPATTQFSLGTPPLVPFVGDWDANGTRTPGTFKGGVVSLYDQIPPVTPTHTVTFGDARGFPVAGDFDADGRDDVAIYRNGTWQIRLTASGATSTVTFGSGAWPATVPLAGDWDGDGRDGIGTYSAGTWTLRNTTTAGAIAPFSFAPGASPYPVVGDWDGDGTDTVGAKSITGPTWSVSNSNTTPAVNLTFDFGLASDLPLTWR
jgi:hypothetical protein